jgi:diacylglycerol kinase (ATP)
MNFEYSDFDADLDQNGKEHYRSFLAAVANEHRFGGGLEICPIADPTDKQLDFIAVREMPKLKIVGAFLKLKQGKLLSVKQTVHKKGKYIKITADIPYTVNVDGELYENIPFEVTLVSDTLKVYRP